MSNKLGQESAFPLVDAQFRDIQWGISKRFYAACAIMQGMVSNSNPLVRSMTTEQKVLLSYQAADELLKQENS